MSYLNAPATALIAVNCACCGKALVDAVSVSVGIGPICRAEYLPADYDPAAHKAANVLIHEAAAEGTTALRQVEIGKELHALGYGKVADRIAERWAKRAEKAVAKAKIKISVDGKWLAVKTPWCPDFVEAIKALPWNDRKWNKDDRVWLVAATQRVELWDALRAHYPGKVGIGPKGAFTIPEAEKDAA